MTSELWALYRRLQTDLAYPPQTVASFQLNERAIVEAQEFCTALVARSGLSSPRTLLIGPGGLNEIEAFKRATNGAIFDVMTAHASEAAVYRNYSVIHADMHDTKLPNASYDLIYASNVLEHAFAPYIALMELRRILSPIGTAYFTLPSFEGVEGGIGPFHLHCLDWRVWQELLHKTGFHVADIKFTPPEAAGIEVQELLTRNPSGEFVTRTGCAHYVSFSCKATTPPSPHDQIYQALVVYNGHRRDR